MRGASRAARARGGALAVGVMLAVAVAAQDRGHSAEPALTAVPPAADSAGSRDAASLFRPPAARAVAPAPAPFTDSSGADHHQRDAQRRALEPAAPLARPRPDFAQPSSPAPRNTLDPAEADAMRRQGDAERDARRGRGGVVLPPVSTPRIQPDAPAAVAMPPPPRQVIPQPGQPGGPPIAVPTCGPAGCFDANGRAMPSAGGGLLMGPGGQPCIRMGAAVTC
jgi:hypothetical protein